MYVNNDDQFTRKTSITRDKFIDLVNLAFLTFDTLSVLN